MFWQKYVSNSAQNLGSSVLKVEYVCLLLIIYSVLPESIPYSAQPFARGLARLMDLTWLSHSYVLPAIKVALALLILPLMRDKGELVFSVVSLGTLMMFYSLEQAQGIAQHSGHLLGLILLAKIVALIFKKRQQQDFIIVATAGFYATSAFSKMLNSAGGWIAEAPQILPTIIKSNDSRYFDHLDASHWGRMDEVVGWLSQHSWLLVGVFFVVFLLECSVILALKGKYWRYSIGIALIIMHLGINFVLNINFTANILCLVLYFLDLPKWLIKKDE